MLWKIIAVNNKKKLNVIFFTRFSFCFRDYNFLEFYLIYSNDVCDKGPCHIIVRHFIVQLHFVAFSFSHGKKL